VNGMATIVEELLRRPNVPEGLRREVESVMRVTKFRLRYRFRVAAGLRDRRSSESWRATRSDAQPTSW
jgi:hypothetical protein